MIGKPLACRCDEVCVLVDAQKLPSPATSQCACGNERRCTGTELDYLARFSAIYLLHDSSKKADIGLPATEMRESVVREAKFVKKGLFVAEPSAPKAAQEPGPADCAEADAPGKFGQLATPVETNPRVGERKHSGQFARRQFDSPSGGRDRAPFATTNGSVGSFGFRIGS